QLRNWSEKVAPKMPGDEATSWPNLTNVVPRSWKRWLTAWASASSETGRPTRRRAASGPSRRTSTRAARNARRRTWRRAGSGSTIGSGGASAGGGDSSGETEGAVLLLGVGVLELENAEAREGLPNAWREQPEPLQVGHDAGEQHPPEQHRRPGGEHVVAHLVTVPAHGARDLIADEAVSHQLAGVDDE